MLTTTQRLLSATTAIVMASASLAAAEPSADLIAAAKKEGTLTTIALPHDWCGYGDVIAGFDRHGRIDRIAVRVEETDRDRSGAAARARQASGTIIGRRSRCYRTSTRVSITPSSRVSLTPRSADGLHVGTRRRRRAGSVRAAARGVDTLVYLVGVPYNHFELHPQLIRKTLVGAIDEGVKRLILIGTVYPFGRPRTERVRARTASARSG